MVETSSFSVDTWLLEGLFYHCVTPGIRNNRLPVFVSFSVAVTKYLTKTTYRGKRFILAHSARCSERSPLLQEGKAAGA